MTTFRKRGKNIAMYANSSVIRRSQTQNVFPAQHKYDLSTVNRKVRGRSRFARPKKKTVRKKTRFARVAGILELVLKSSNTAQFASVRWSDRRPKIWKIDVTKLFNSSKRSLFAPHRKICDRATQERTISFAGWYKKNLNRPWQTNFICWSKNKLRACALADLNCLLLSVTGRRVGRANRTESVSFFRIAHS